MKKAPAASSPRAAPRPPGSRTAKATSWRSSRASEPLRLSQGKDFELTHRIQRISPCPRFDDQAQAAATFYASVFENSRITEVSHYGEAGREIHGRPGGSVMKVEFELDGQTFTALDGGPAFEFNEAVSLQIDCDAQDEIDHW